LILKKVTIKEIKEGLNLRSRGELLEICLHLARFKKENKELLAYLLFESADEQAYITGIKKEIDEQFEQINRTSIYFIKKSIRKILRTIRKYIRYSQKKETEVELLIYFCFKMKHFSPPVLSNPAMKNLYERLMVSIKKTLRTLHEDLQYDYAREMEGL